MSNPVPRCEETGFPCDPNYGMPYGPGVKAYETWRMELDTNLRREMRRRGRFHAVRYFTKMLCQAVLGRL